MLTSSYELNRYAHINAINNNETNNLHDIKINKKNN